MLGATGIHPRNPSLGRIFPTNIPARQRRKLWLADGYHRWHAATIAGLQTIAADVRPGGWREAILYSVGANAEHGWRRSNDDKRKAVLTLLADPGWAAWSDREIARQCGVVAPLVGSLRPKPCVSGLQIDADRPTTRKVARSGTVDEQATSGINADRRQPDPEPDYPLREDPRQVDIVDAVAAYDRAAGDLRVRVSELVKQLAAANWPIPEEAHAAWMKGRGRGYRARRTGAGNAGRAQAVVT